MIVNKNLYTLIEEFRNNHTKRQTRKEELILVFLKVLSLYSKVFSVKPPKGDSKYDNLIDTLTIYLLILKQCSDNETMYADTDFNVYYEVNEEHLKISSLCDIYYKYLQSDADRLSTDDVKDVRLFINTVLEQLIEITMEIKPSSPDLDYYKTLINIHLNDKDFGK